MSRAVTLLALRTRVREYADIGPDTTTGRYPNARISGYINESWCRAREIATMAGNGLLYLKTTGILTMPAGALNAGTNFGTLPLPADCLSIHGIDVIFSSNDIRSLENISWGDRNNYRDLWSPPTGQPAGFQIINIGTESGASVTAGSVAIFPAPDRAYQYNLWYLPAWTDKTSDTDVFDTISGVMEDFVVLDAVIKILLADNDSAQSLQIALEERNKAEALLSSRVNRTQRVGPTRRRDVAGESRRRRALGNWRLP